MSLWADDNEDQRAGNGTNDYFDAVVDKTKQPKTKNNYKTLHGHFVVYCEQWFPHVLNDAGRVQLERIDLTVFKGFFEHVMQKRVKGPFSAMMEPPTLNTPGYMMSYKSAILWGFKQAGASVQADHKEKIDEFITGYGNHYNEAKQRGEVPTKEGKTPMSFSG